MTLPEQFEKNMKELLGAEYQEYINSYESERVYGLRVNTRKISVEKFLEITPFHLEPIPWTENGFYYQAEDAVTKHPHYFAGLYYIQEPTAMIPASRLPVDLQDRVLDLCAAPGGKATELGARLLGTGLLTANDISHSRSKGLLKNLELFGTPNILVTSETPENLLNYFPEYFDKILIDAPCSGEGMFRKDSAMIKSWVEHGPEYYAKIQRSILEAAVGMLKPGGMLLYSTCTFSPLENEEMIRGILETYEDLQLVKPEWSPSFCEGILPETVRIWPHKAKGEGHFAALIYKKGSRADVKKKAKPVSLDKLPKEAADFLRPFAFLKKSSGDLQIRDHKIYLLPDELPGLRGLRFIRTGLYLGECKKNRFEPSQALAMYLSPSDCGEQYISFPADDPRTIRYLKGETVELTEDEIHRKKGWILVCTDGYSLGWAKVVNGTLRNKYYPGWRYL